MNSVLRDLLAVLASSFKSINLPTPTVVPSGAKSGIYGRNLLALSRTVYMWWIGCRPTNTWRRRRVQSVIATHGHIRRRAELTLDDWVDQQCDCSSHCSPTHTHARPDV